MYHGWISQFCNLSPCRRKLNWSQQLKFLSPLASCRKLISASSTYQALLRSEILFRDNRLPCGRLLCYIRTNITDITNQNHCFCSFILFIFIQRICCKSESSILMCFLVDRHPLLFLYKRDSKFCMYQGWISQFFNLSPCRLRLN